MNLKIIPPRHRVKKEIKPVLFKTVVFEIQVQDRRNPIMRCDKKDAIETAKRTSKKYPNKKVRIVQIIKSYSEVDFT